MSKKFCAKHPALKNTQIRFAEGEFYINAEGLVRGLDPAEAAFFKKLPKWVVDVDVDEALPEEQEIISLEGRLDRLSDRNQALQAELHELHVENASLKAQIEQMRELSGDGADASLATKAPAKKTPTRGGAKAAQG